MNSVLELGKLIEKISDPAASKELKIAIIKDALQDSVISREEAIDLVIEYV